MGEQTKDGDDGGAAAAELVARIRGGDRRAEAELVERYCRPLSYLLRHLTRDPGLAEDLQQETLRLVLEKARAGQIQEPARLAAFLRGVARNLASAAGRKRRRTEPEPEGVAASLPDPRPGQLSRVLEREDRLRVRRLIGELRSERDRQVLWRFHLAEETREEICHDLGLTSSQFNVVLFRARQRFKTLVEQAGLGPAGVPVAGGGPVGG